MANSAERDPSERGAVAAEYAVLMALVVLALIGLIAGMTAGMASTMQTIINVLN